MSEDPKLHLIKTDTNLSGDFPGIKRAKTPQGGTEGVPQATRRAAANGFYHGEFTRNGKPALKIAR